MKDPKQARNSDRKAEKSGEKKQHAPKPDEDSIAEGGFMLTTSEILDFSEGTDSTP